MLKARLVPPSIVLCVALAVFAQTPAKAGSWDVDVNFLLGVKYLNSDWDTPAEDFSTMGTFGVNTSWAPEEWPVRIAADFIVNADVAPTFGLGYGVGGDRGAITSEVGLRRAEDLEAELGSPVRGWRTQRDLCVSVHFCVSAVQRSSFRRWKLLLIRKRLSLKQGRPFFSRRFFGAYR